MRSVVPILLAVACPIGMCLVPMLLKRRRGEQANCHQPAVQTDASEVALLREEVTRLRAAQEPSGDIVR